MNSISHFIIYNLVISLYYRVVYKDSKARKTIQFGTCNICKIRKTQNSFPFRNKKSYLKCKITNQTIELKLLIGSTK